VQRTNHAKRPRTTNETRMGESRIGLRLCIPDSNDGAFGPQTSRQSRQGVENLVICQVSLRKSWKVSGNESRCLRW